MIRDSLCLDHIYLHFPPAEITQLRTIAKGLSRCDYRKVHSANDHWSGVYLRSNLGSYFEMLEENKLGKLGIACSPFQIQYVDPLLIRKELPMLPWKTGVRYLESSRKVWFRWASMKPRPESEADDDVLFSWVMAYHPIHDSTRVKKRPQASLDRFQRLVVRMGVKRVPSVRYHSRFLPGSREFGAKKIRLKIPNRDGGEFTIEIKLVAGNQPPDFVELNATLCPTVRRKAIRADDLETSVRGDEFVLRRRPQ